MADGVRRAPQAWRRLAPWAFAAAAVALALAACAGPPAPALLAEARLPHIVLIVPDDLGRQDVSFHGGEIATPNIDRLATEGVVLDRFHTAPICSPTRAGLMTGRYPIRFGLMQDVIAPWEDFGLDTSEVTLAEALAEAGYEHRAMFGKWHLGHLRRAWHPLQRGFTESVSHNTSIDHFTKERFGERDWFHGHEPAVEEGYVTDLVAEHAASFIERHAADEVPFFLYVPFNAVHSPLQAREEDLPRYAHLQALAPPLGWEEVTAGRPLPPEETRRADRQVHAAMVHALDQGVGRILDALDQNGIAEDSLVLFFSDNGGGLGAADNGPLRGTKSTVFEGGTRVAAAARWPAGGIAGGHRVAGPVAYIDVLPTLMGIAGIGDHGGGELDGVDVLDVLTGIDPDGDADRELYSFVGQKNPVRQQVSATRGEWKLVVIGPALVDEAAAAASDVMLFRLADDPGEERDVAAEHPEVVADLLERAMAFRALQPSRFVRGFGAPGGQGFEPPPNWVFPEG